MDNQEVIGVQRDQVADVWQHVAPMLARALEKNGDRVTLKCIREALDKEEMQLFIVVAQGRLLAACVTDLFTYPNGEKSLHIAFLAGSRMAKWLQFIRGLEGWAIEKGCVELCFEGRAGWERATRDPETKTPRYEEIGRMFSRRLIPPREMPNG